MSTLIEDGSVVLFQGDSVTDAGRGKQADGDLGRGYAMIAAAWFSALYPEKQVKFLNRGISGNRVKDLQARWREDCIDLNPKWVSILIGINDCWRRYDQNDPTSLDKFAADYHDILSQTKSETDARLILCEPFVLPVPEDRKKWREDLDPKIQVVRELAAEFGAIYVPFDGMLAQAAMTTGPAFWAADGVHPTAAGHALMARFWLQAVKAL